MAKLTILYMRGSCTGGLFGMELKVKIGEDKIFEVTKDKFNTIELEKGKHSITMYVERYSEKDIIGYVNTEVDINDDDNYFVYKAPSIATKPGKFFKVNNKEELENLIKKRDDKEKLSIVIVIIMVIVLYFLKLFVI